MDSIFADNSILDDLYGDVEFSDEDLKPRASSVCNKAGKYHVVVMGVKGENPDHEGVNSTIRLDLQIVAGEHDDQVKAMIYHRVRLFKVEKDDKGKPIGRVPYSKEYVAQTMRAAAGLGLIPYDASAKLSQINWEAAIGHQAVVKVDASKETDKDGKERTAYEINFGNFWRPDDDAVADVPKDGEALAMLNYGGGGQLDDSELDGI